MTRKEAAEFWNGYLHFGKKGPAGSSKMAWHVGKEEIKEFLDLLYGGPPQSDDEKLLTRDEAMRIANIRRLRRWGCVCEEPVVSVSFRLGLHCGNCGVDSRKKSS